MKIVVFRYYGEIVTPLCIWYDPRRINNYSKNSLPAVPLRGPKAGVLHI